MFKNRSQGYDRYGGIKRSGFLFAPSEDEQFSVFPAAGWFCLFHTAISTFMDISNILQFLAHKSVAGALLIWTHSEVQLVDSGEKIRLKEEYEAIWYHETQR